MAKQRLSSFGHTMRRQDSLEKTAMSGEDKGRRRKETSREMDRFYKGSHNFVLEQLMIPMLRAELTFTINPVNLMESTPAGRVLSQAYDSAGNGTRIAYSILGHSDEFSIDPGIIKNKKAFNFETDDKQYDLLIELKFTDHKEMKLLIIHIIDIPEKPECTDLEFVMGRASVTVDENSPVFQSIYKVEATDEDLVNGDKLRYTMETELSVPKEGGIFFSLDPETGIVRRNSRQPLDYDEGYHVMLSLCKETLCNDEGHWDSLEVFQFVMRVTDTTGNFCQGTLIVHIRDLNDEKPTFEPLPSVIVAEKEPVGTIIATVKAVDRDADSNITYMFAKPQTLFGLDAKTGAITLLEPLDSASSKVHPLKIVARDNGNTHTASCTVMILVEDVNHQPVCDPSLSTGTGNLVTEIRAVFEGISVSVPETFPAATAVYTILARDPDPGEEIEFSILHSSVNTTTYFQLDPTNGGIYCIAETALDYETDPKMVVAAKEKEKPSPESCTGTITIHIQNVNDEAPVFVNTSRTHVNILENLPFGTLVARLAAVDRDIGDTVHYEFVGSYRGFAINADTGEVITTFPMDYEDPTVLHEKVLEIRAFDNARRHSTTTQLTITLQDVNDNPPTCAQDLHVIEVPENIPIGTSLFTLICEDRDGTAPNNVLSYSLTLDEFSSEMFTLVGNEIKVGPRQLNYDAEAFAAMQFKHVFTVNAWDGGTPRQTTLKLYWLSSKRCSKRSLTFGKGITTIIVKVTRSNEIIPHTWTNIFYVIENSNIGTLVGRVAFTDEDWPFNNLKYSIVGDSVGHPPRFYIEPDTGNIKVLNALDREIRSQYFLWVKAIDLDNDIEPDPIRQKSSIAVVTINILNVNDEPPVCWPPYYNKIIYSTIKTSVLQLNCSDKDSPAHELSYTIVGGNTHNRFKLQRVGSGPPSLMTTQSFQYDVFRGIQDPTSFQLLIEVADQWNGDLASRLSSTATVIVHVVPWSTSKPSATAKTTTTVVSSKYT
ncbi:Protocadherin Fat 2 [Varanus komodoensis]|nr:Protocadherin Fat 2 [Varanus komodoensis]